MLEKAYLRNDTVAVTKMLNNWARKSASDKKVTYNITDEPAIEIYDRFMDDFMNGRLTGILHNDDNWFCRFVKSPYLFLRPQFKYIYVRTISDSLRHGVLKIADLATNPNSDLYRNFDPDGILFDVRKIAGSIKNVSIQIDVHFYERFKNKYGILPISATNDYRKCLVNFWGYMDITRRFTALRYPDPPPEEKQRRLDFLNKALCSDKPAEKIIGFGGELGVYEIYILDNIKYAVVSYYIKTCSYIAIYNLNKLDDKAYIPGSFADKVE